jgi:hypothetical protein
MYRAMARGRFSLLLAPIAQTRETRSVHRFPITGYNYLTHSDEPPDLEPFRNLLYGLCLGVLARQLWYPSVGIENRILFTEIRTDP